MRDKVYCFAEFSLPALLSLSEQLRGQRCTCDVSQMPKNGSLNWAVFVSFEDGIEWVFRSPKNEHHLFDSKETAARILASEASTLLYLKGHTSIPVPEIFAYRSGDNDSGVPYILQSKASGRSLGSYDWSQVPEEVVEVQHRQPRMPMSDENRAKVMNQLGCLMAELSTCRFAKIGSLFDDGNQSYVVGERLSPSLTWQERDSLELDRGPFAYDCQYLSSIISAFTAHAKELYISPHVFLAPVPDRSDYKGLDSCQAATRRWIDFMEIGQKIQHSRDILSYCIAGQFLSEMIPHLTTSAGSSFTLCHPDLHLGNIFVDEDLNTTCIIDWGSASTGPISKLLVAPSLASSSVPPPGHLTAAFRSGFSQRVTEGTTDIPYSDLWQISERMWYLTRLTRLLSKNDYRLFARRFWLTYGTTSDGGDDEGEADILRLFRQRAEQARNVKILAELQDDDVTAEEMQELETAWFTPRRTANSDVLAVARKLTLMSEMNPSFLADHRLCKCVGEACTQVRPA